MPWRRPLLGAAALVVAVLFAGLGPGAVAPRSAAASPHAAAAATGGHHAAAPAVPAVQPADSHPLRFLHRSGPLLFGLGATAVFAIALVGRQDRASAAPRRPPVGERGRPRAPPLLV